MKNVQKPVFERLYNMTFYWRAAAFQKYVEHSPTKFRAYVFSEVLKNIEPDVYSENCLCGSISSYMSDILPPGITEDDYKQALEMHSTVGQRTFGTGWDHTLVDLPVVLREGIGGFIIRAEESKTRSDAAQNNYLDAMIVTLKAFSAFVVRFADVARDNGCYTLADDLQNISINPANSFFQAVQLVWLIQLALNSEGRNHMALGRIDQYLYPFYKSDMETGIINRDDAYKIIYALWEKIDESGGIVNICLGGVTPTGGCGVNELSYICLEATKELKSIHPNISARLNRHTPEKFHKACWDVIRTGIGFPALFSEDITIKGLVKYAGIPLEAARDYCMVGCIETVIPGRQPAWSDSRFNIASSLVKTIEKTFEQNPETFDVFFEKFKGQLFQDLKQHENLINNNFLSMPPDKYPDIFLSALTRGCIESGKDINDGGAEFPRFHGIGGVGLATVADSLAVIKKFVYEEKKLSLCDLRKVLDDNFVGHENLRLMFENKAPKYGNNIDSVDQIAAAVVDYAAKASLDLKLVNDGLFIMLMAANVQNVSLGHETPATPDGRLAGEPLSDAASPHFGRDMRGPTAFLGSVATPEYKYNFGGNVINMKFQPSDFKGQAGLNKLTMISKVMVQRQIPELQFNFTGNEILEDARLYPEKHSNLIVRVSGFSDYFVKMSPEVQNDIIRRNTHTM